VIGGRILVALTATALLPCAAAAVCAPAASAIFPASGTPGTSVTATISGSALDGGTVTVFGPPGLIATVQSSTPEALSVHLDVAPDASTGERILFVETPGGTTGVSFTVNPPNGLVVGGVSPPLLATQGIELDAVVTGTNLGGVGVSGVTLSGSGVGLLAATPSADGTSLTVAFSVDPAAAPGTRAVTIASAAGSAVLELYVQRPAPSITAVHPAAGEVGATVSVTITGANLTGAALVVTTPVGGSAGDVSITDVATPDDGTLIATITIASGLTPPAEPVLLIVTTESGQTTAEFFIVAPGVPTITSIRPGAGSANTTVPVTLHGLHFTSLGVTTSSSDLTLSSATVVDDETITVDVFVKPAATLGAKTLTVGTASTSFVVIPAGTPFIGAVRPPFGNRGSTFTFVVEGVNLTTLVPGTGVDILDPSNKIHASNAAAVDDQDARATITVDPTANVGSRNVRVTTGGGTYTTTASPFRVNIPGQVPSISDVSPTTVPPAATTAMTVTGSNFTGAGVVVTGPGATVTNVVVDGSATHIAFDLTLAPDAPDENRAVIVVTENGTARCGIASDPSPPPFTPAKLVKTGARFLAPAPGFRLFVFEFSLGPLFTPGRETVAIADPVGDLVLNRLQAFDVERAFREAHRGWVRVRAVTATNRIAASAAQPIRR
jgi:IPT/TIG domain-containing protein